mmetsp:Transcript_16531/g.23560  ORF Transcript_16531/g.23560 Transcript_16531/m.23560 type:complete len:197 (+) Transcript_16531:320-910(+)
MLGAHEQSTTMHSVEQISKTLHHCLQRYKDGLIKFLQGCGSRANPCDEMFEFFKGCGSRVIPREEIQLLDEIMLDSSPQLIIQSNLIHLVCRRNYNSSTTLEGASGDCNLGTGWKKLLTNRSVGRTTRYLDLFHGKFWISLELMKDLKDVKREFREQAGTRILRQDAVGFCDESLTPAKGSHWAESRYDLQRERSN